jgi:hypothetical protein
MAPQTSRQSVAASEIEKGAVVAAVEATKAGITVVVEAVVEATVAVTVVEMPERHPRHQQVRETTRVTHRRCKRGVEGETRIERDIQIQTIQRSVQNFVIVL